MVNKETTKILEFRKREGKRKRERVRGRRRRRRRTRMTESVVYLSRCLILYVQTAGSVKDSGKGTTIKNKKQRDTFKTTKKALIFKMFGKVRIILKS